MLMLTVNGVYFIKSKLAKIVTLNMNFEKLLLESHFKLELANNFYLKWEIITWNLL